jgi:hypothetical protein
MSKKYGEDQEKLSSEKGKLKIESIDFENNTPDYKSSINLVTLYPSNKSSELSAPNTNSSNRVHFIDSNKSNQNGTTPSKYIHHSPSLLSRMNLKSLQLDVIEDDYVEESEINNISSIGIKITESKVSSYTLSSAAADSKSIINKNGIANPPLQQQKSFSIDYRTVLPKLNKKGLVKWANLSSQLKLPIHLVKIAVKAKLGSLIDLFEEEDEE